MKPCYINSVGCVTTQNTIDNSQFLDDIVPYQGNVVEIVKPNYKDFNMQGAAVRRMAKGVKMGIVASTIALKEAEIETPDAIITGTGLGCVVDSEKFVSAIIDNDEQFLTPTPFIQSTHNTVGGQIALNLKCKSYNFTYVNGAISFESCLIDGQLMIDENNASDILIGGIDELAAHTVKIHKLNHHIKQEEAITSSEVINSQTKGAVFGEGANFFVLSDTQKSSSYAKLIDTETYFTLKKDSLTTKLHDFLTKNNVSTNDIDAIILGNNGDGDFDAFYSEITNKYNNIPQVVYKHLSGEYFTASSFGFWVGCKILKEQKIPKDVSLNNQFKDNYQRILLYNQYRGKDHSFILLEKC